MHGLFGSKEMSRTPRGGHAARIPRHSHGWGDMLKYLQSRESLKVLDIGSTSSANINYLTGLGHSIYMANLVEEAAKPEWMTQNEEGDAVFDVDRFLASNMNFSGRSFDAVLLWDAVDYLPEALAGPVFSHIYNIMEPVGQMLCFFHVTLDPNARFCRYHLTGNDVVDMQQAGDYPLLHAYSNRKIENFLSGYSSYRFFLAKDGLREVIIVR